MKDRKQTAETVMRHAERSAALIELLKERLGSSYFTRGEDVVFVLTRSGRTVIEYGDTTFFTDAHGEPIAGRPRGGRLEFAYVTPFGMGDWMRAPVGDPTLN